MHSAKNTNVNHVNKKNIKKEEQKVYLTVKQQRGRQRPSKQTSERASERKRKEESTKYRDRAKQQHTRPSNNVSNPSAFVDFYIIFSLCLFLF